MDPRLAHQGPSRAGPRRAVALLAAALLVEGVFMVAAAHAATVPIRWTQRSPANTPGLRALAAAATDRTNGKVVVFGGITNATVGDTWTWDGTTWTQQFPSASPSARYGAAMAGDPSSGHAVLFSGDVGSADTWSWDGTTWTQRFPATSPPARFGASMATDAASGRVVLFGGTPGGSGLLGDTWTWDGTTWTQHSGGSAPTARDYAAVATDPSSGHVLLFGGDDSSGWLGDTWTWDGVAWTKHTPTTSPPARFSALMAADPASGHVVLFGGCCNSTTGGAFADTWTWDGATWTQQSPPTSPTGRFWAATATDPHGRIVFYGGADAGLNSFGDTWSLTPALAISPNSGPKGTTVSLQGVGFTAGATVSVKYSAGTTETKICSGTVASDSFTCTGKIPRGAAGGTLGPHKVTGKDTSAIKATTTFTLT